MSGQTCAAPEGAFIAHAGDTGDDGAEHHRSDHHLDERVAKRFQGNGLLRPKMPDQRTQQHGEENLEVERFYKFHGITHF